MDELINNWVLRGFEEDYEIVEWLKEILLAFDKEQKLYFLLFVTGIFSYFFNLQGSRVSPAEGFKLCPIIIQKYDQNDVLLPFSAQCSKTLFIPVYNDQRELKEKLILSIYGSQ